jgi:hypothetical protein
VVEALRKICHGLSLLLALLVLPTGVFAHQLDEYLQTTLVDIEPGKIRLQMDLTPGVAVAERLLGLIDRNHDGVISPDESAAYAELMKRDLVVRLDGREVELKVVACNFPESAELRTGCGIILIDYTLATGGLGAGAHKLTLENRHQPVASVYLFNAARPRSAAVEITGQTRNENQSTGEIAFDFHPPPRPPVNSRVAVSFAALLIPASLVGVGIIWAARSRRRVPGAIVLGQPDK